MYHYTYVLHSRKDGALYAGYTADLQGRLEAHNQGSVASTKDRQPLELIYAELCLSKADALKREKYFKTHYGRWYIRRRLKSYFTGCKDF